VESGESGKLPLKFVGFAKLARPPSKLNSTAISENLPLRRSSKMTLGTQPESIYYDNFGNYLDTKTGSLTSKTLGVIYENIENVISDSVLRVNIRKGKLYNKDGRVSEIGILRFKDNKNNIVDLFNGKIVDGRGVTLVQNLYEFYDLEGKRLNFYGEDTFNSTKNYRPQKSDIEVGGTQEIFDFDLRRLDLGTHQIFDGRGNVICDRIGLFRDRQGGTVDLTTGLVRDSLGGVVRTDNYLLVDEYSNTANLKARKICNIEGIIIFKDIGIV
jgi:hypothetical protein